MTDRRKILSLPLTKHQQEQLNEQAMFQKRWGKGHTLGSNQSSSSSFFDKLSFQKTPALKDITVTTSSELERAVMNRGEKNSMKKLIISEGSCNDIMNVLEICNCENLERIIVKKNALRNVNSLKIANCSNLSVIDIEDGYEENGAFYNVNKVVIESIFSLFV